ncbi:unnamed protein product, partial [Rotaria sordida]
MHNKQQTIHEPFLTNSVKYKHSSEYQSHSHVGRIISGVAVASVYGLIVLGLLLAIPITLLVIGSRYRDPRYCPIEPRISLFLIVHGIVSL